MTSKQELSRIAGSHKNLVGPFSRVTGNQNEYMYYHNPTVLLLAKHNSLDL